MTTSVSGHSPGEQLEIDAEIQRLARLLKLSHDELDYLRELPSRELRALRDQVTARLFDSQGALVNLAAATRVLPVSLVASLSEKVFGAMLSARIAGLLDSDRAVDIAARLPVAFLADVALELDPRRVADILAKIPALTVAAVTRELVSRGEWVAISTFYGYLPRDSIRAAIAEADASALLRIALVLEDKAQLSAVLAVAPDGTLAAIAAAAESEGLAGQLRALSGYLSPEQQAQLPA